jgi:hypothetical protein
LLLNTNGRSSVSLCLMMIERHREQRRGNENADCARLLRAADASLSGSQFPDPAAKARDSRK